MKLRGFVGVVFIVLAIVLFIGYWYYLLEPLQLKLLNANASPDIELAIFRSIVVATLFAFLTFVGAAYTGASKFGKDKLKGSFKELFSSSAYWWWTLLANVCILIFTLFWALGNF